MNHVNKENLLGYHFHNKLKDDVTQFSEPFIYIFGNLAMSQLFALNIL